MKKTLLFLSILPLVGCMSRDLKVSPQVAVPDSFASASEFSGLDAGESAWWASFGDPALPELVRKALANNRSLKAAGASVEIARRQRMGAVSDLFPSIALVGQAISQETLIDPDGTTQGQVYGVGATWELDIFGQNRNKARALYQMQYAEAEKQRGARLAVASETARAYLTLQNVLARKAILAEAIAAQTRMLDIVEGRLPEGLSVSFDVDRAKARLAATQALMPKLEAAEAKLTGALAVLTGESAEGFKVPVGAGWASVTVPEPPKLLPSEVLQRRPDVQAAKRIVEAQMYALGAAKAAYYPKFNLNLLAANEYLQFSLPVGVNSSGAVYDLNGPVTDMGLSATLPILTFGKIRNAVKGQEAKLDAVAALYENSILTAIAEVGSAYHSYAAGKRRADSLSASAASALSAYGKIQGLYEGGLADMTDVLTTETACLEQRDACLQGGLELVNAAIDLHNALGPGAEPQDPSMPSHR